MANSTTDFFETLVIVVSAFQFIFYWMQFKAGRCNWEVLYMATAEVVVYSLNVGLANTPGLLAASTSGSPVIWIRYGAWLVTCPVLLMILTNLSGDGKYDLRKTMLIILIDQLMIVLGVSAAFTENNGIKVLLFILSTLCGLMLYLMVYFIFQYSYATITEDAHGYIRGMSMCFFITWILYPTFFLLGPEGPIGTLDPNTSKVGHAIADLIAKNTYSFLAWNVRWNFVEVQKAGSVASLSDVSVGSDDEPLNVLFVDEEGEVEDVIMDALGDLHMNADAVDTEDMSRSLRKGKYDVMIVNCFDDDATGFEAAAALRKNKKYKSLPILGLVTRTASDDLLARVTEAGVTTTMKCKPSKISTKKLGDALSAFRDADSSSSESDDSDSSEDVRARGRGRKQAGRKASGRAASKGRKRRDDDSDDDARSVRFNRSKRSSSRKAPASRPSSRSAKKSSGKDGIQTQSSIGRALSFFDGTGGK
jgi:bacteriorhodopsin